MPRRQVRRPRILLTQDKAAPTPATSLADRITSGEMTTEKEVDKASATSPGEKEKDQQDTNLIQNKYEVAVKLQDMQADPNSPLYSVKSFEDLGLY
jgi:ATP-dependent RNA helicase DDX19/DBP5